MAERDELGYEVSGIFAIRVVAATEVEAKNRAIGLLTNKEIPHYVMEVKKADLPTSTSPTRGCSREPELVQED